MHPDWLSLLQKIVDMLPEQPFVVVADDVYSGDELGPLKY
jgi:hypothetical protein